MDGDSAHASGFRVGARANLVMRERSVSYAKFSGQGSAERMRNHFDNGKVVNRMAGQESELARERGSNPDRGRVRDKQHPHMDWFVQGCFVQAEQLSRDIAKRGNEGQGALFEVDITATRIVIDKTLILAFEQHHEMFDTMAQVFADRRFSVHACRVLLEGDGSGNCLALIAGEKTTCDGDRNGFCEVGVTSGFNERRVHGGSTRR